MKGIRTLIVDDEPVARKVMREELEQIHGITIVGEAEDGKSALRSIAELQPDLVFLDLQMPGLGGFEVIRRLQPVTEVPVIVVVTAFDQYAIQAFEAGAIDYLLKPVGQDRLIQSIERATKLLGYPAAMAEQFAQIQQVAASAQARSPRKVVARSGDEYLLLNTQEVFAFEAEVDLVWIITARKRYLATQTLKVIQEKLRDTSFRRIHRNALVNLDHVRKMSTLTSQRWLVTLTNDQEYIVSKRQAKGVRELLSW